MQHRISLVMSVVASLGSLAARAQAPLPAQQPASNEVVTQGGTLKDGFTVKNGRLLVTEQGRTNPLTQDMTLTNGTKVSTAGVVTMTNGTTATLQEGDMLSLSGRLTSAAMRAEQNSLTTAGQAGNGKKGKRK